MNFTDFYKEYRRANLTTGKVEVVSFAENAVSFWSVDRHVYDTGLPTDEALFLVNKWNRQEALVPPIRFVYWIE